MKRKFDIPSFLRSVFEIRQAILVFRPDIIHCHSSFAGGFGRLACYLLRKNERPKIVYTPNALPIHLGKRFEYIERFFARFTDLFISISDSEGREIIQYCKVSPDRVATVWPSIDCSYYSPIFQDCARKTLGFSPDEKVIVGMGRLCEQKDPMGFLEIYKRLKLDFPKLRAIWIGDGELRESVRELQTKFGLDGLLITGWVCDVRPFIAAANVVIVPSRYESFGYVTAESQAVERPVVATRVNGSVDIIEDCKTGYLFDEGNIPDAVDKIRSLLCDCEKETEMGRAGRIRVSKKFSSSEMRNNLMTAYGKVVKLDLIH